MKRKYVRAEKEAVTLDELFGNDAVSMADISKRIISMIQKTDSKERFHIARDIGWQVERGLFNFMETEEKYNPKTIQSIRNSSYILNDYGFTLISNGKEPFFSVFPEPEEGFGDFLSKRDNLQKLFSVLSHTHTLNALIDLYRKKENYVFESTVIARDCGIPEDEIENVMSELSFLGVICKSECIINGEKRTLYQSKPTHKILALFLIGGEVLYKGAYSLQAHYRNEPLIK